MKDLALRGYAERAIEVYVHAVAQLARHYKCSPDLEDGVNHNRVTFRYVDSRSHQTRRLSLPVHAFIARFLQHVLLKGFPKV
jgi:hypothetical protein